MQLNRNVDISIYRFLTENLPAAIQVLDGYPTGYNGNPSTELSLPTVAIVNSGVEFTPHQLGGGDLPSFIFIIDIYGRTKVQRGDIVYRIHEILDNRSFPIYDHSVSIPSTDQIGHLILEGTVQSGPLYVFPKLNEKLFWAEELSFMGFYSPKAS